MKSLWKCLVQSAMVVGVSTCSTAAIFAQDDGQAGIVRITKPRTADSMRGPVSMASASNMADGCMTGSAPQASAGPTCDPSMGIPGSCHGGSCPNGFCDGAYGYGSPYGAHQNWRFRDWQSSPTMGSSFRHRTQAHSLAVENSMHAHGLEHRGSCDTNGSGQAMLDYFRCKFGYFVPSGGGGQGIPWVGHYGRVYPVNPYYQDARDGQAYAAQGYGIPMAVPLAPVVGHTYEYSNGVPSSRLTPVSHPAY